MRIIENRRAVLFLFDEIEKKDGLDYWQEELRRRNDEEYNIINNSSPLINNFFFFKKFCNREIIR